MSDEATPGGHQTPEDRIAANEQFAIFDDLDGLSDETLFAIAQECDQPALPDECVPCRAFAILMDRGNEEVDEEGETTANEITTDTIHQTQIPFNPNSPEDMAALQAEIDALQKPPVVNQIAARVRELDDLLVALLEGPPIPPPDVSLEELAALTVGAKKWLAMIDAQGLELAPGQEAVRRSVEAAVAKVQRG